MYIYRGEHIQVNFKTTPYVLKGYLTTTVITLVMVVKLTYSNKKKGVLLTMNNTKVNKIVLAELELIWKDFFNEIVRNTAQVDWANSIEVVHNNIREQLNISNKETNFVKMYLYGWVDTKHLPKQLADKVITNESQLRDMFFPFIVRRTKWDMSHA